MRFNQYFLCGSSVFQTSIPLSSRGGCFSTPYSSFLPDQESGPTRLLSFKDLGILACCPPHRKFFVVVATGFALSSLRIAPAGDLIPEGEKQDQQGGQAEKHGPGKGEKGNQPSPGVWRVPGRSVQNVLTNLPILQMKELRLRGREGLNLNPDLIGSHISGFPCFICQNQRPSTNPPRHRLQPTPKGWNLSRINMIWRLLV